MIRAHAAAATLRAALPVMVATACIVITGCAAIQDGTPDRFSGAPAPDDLISLADTVDPFREWFNAAADRPRFVAIVSSTCGPCVSGAVTANETILKRFDPADIDASIVWIDMLPTDGADSAARASSIFADPRVMQFHDPDQRLGDAMAPGLLTRGPAWDIYLFYPTGACWNDGPPPPADWMHQLGGGVADAGRYKTDADLAARMHEAMIRLGFKSDRPAPDAARLAAARSAATERIGEAACGATAAAPGRCERCSKSGSIGQCSIAGWRYVVASRIRDEADAPTNRFQMSGGAAGPVALDEVNPAYTRHAYSIEGMTCPDCVIAVAGKALQARGVSRVEVDYDAKRLIVYTTDEAVATLELLPMHLGLAGYQVEPLSR